MFTAIRRERNEANLTRSPETPETPFDSFLGTSRTWDFDISRQLIRENLDENHIQKGRKS